MASCSFNEGSAALVGNIPHCDLLPMVLNTRMQSVYDGNVIHDTYFTMSRARVKDVIPSQRRSLTQQAPVLSSFVVDT